MSSQSRDSFQAVLRRHGLKMKANCKWLVKQSWGSQKPFLGMVWERGKQALSLPSRARSSFSFCEFFSLQTSCSSKACTLVRVFLPKPSNPSYLSLSTAVHKSPLPVLTPQCSKGSSGRRHIILPPPPSSPNFTVSWRGSLGPQSIGLWYRAFSTTLPGFFRGLLVSLSAGVTNTLFRVVCFMTHL